mmetsp:Transcript_75553/g.179502  ORF Transcript_75553/g.179502 Transcript_75553/m.179502 type:complete len:265 (-) Transcript_75553:67-861(-)
MAAVDTMDDQSEMLVGRVLENLSLGGVAGAIPQQQLPRRYKKPVVGEVSTYAGAGLVPVCRGPDGEVRMLLWQPQAGKKKGVRWFDFGGRKLEKKEFTSNCACRKFAKQTYGVFGCQINVQGVPPEKAKEYLSELYQGHCNLPLMLKASQEWAQLQLLDDNPKIFYNDVHEYHVYLINVPYVPPEILDEVSLLVDGGKRKFKWLSSADFKDEGEHVLAPRLLTEHFQDWINNLPNDIWVRYGQAYGDADIRKENGSFAATVVPK